MVYTKNAAFELPDHSACPVDSRMRLLTLALNRTLIPYLDAESVTLISSVSARTVQQMLMIFCITGFMKRLPFTSRKKGTSGSATIHKISDQRVGNQASTNQNGVSAHASSGSLSKDNCSLDQNLQKVGCSLRRQCDL